jgi:hypothetical protein
MPEAAGGEKRRRRKRRPTLALPGHLSNRERVVCGLTGTGRGVHRPGQRESSSRLVNRKEVNLSMAYDRIFRVYRLTEPQPTQTKAWRQWNKQLKEHDQEYWFEEQFPVHPRSHHGWLGQWVISTVSQIIGK